MMTTDTKAHKGSNSMNGIETVILPAIAKLRAIAVATNSAGSADHRHLRDILDLDALMRVAETASGDIESLHFDRANLERDIQDIRSKLTAAHNEIAKRESDRSTTARRFEEVQRIAAEAEQRASTYQQKADEGLRVAQEFQRMVIELQDRRLGQRLKRWIGLTNAAR